MMCMLIVLMISITNLKEFFFLNIKMEMNQTNNFLLIISSMFFMMYLGMKSKEEESLKNEILSSMFLLITMFSNLMFLTTSLILMFILIEMTIYPMMKNFMNLSSGVEKKESLMFMVNINLAGSMMFMWFISAMGMLDTYLLSFDLHSSKSSYLLLMFSFMLLTKVPMIFTQFWLTKAHVSASGTCSMLLASVMLKLGSYGLMKFMNLIKMSMMKMNETIFTLNIVGMVAMIMVMIRFNDLKVMVACSSIVHMAITIPLIYQMKFAGMVASLLVMVNHGIISSLFFMIVTMSYEMTSSRVMEYNSSMESFNKQYSTAFFLLAFINMGIPPLMGFYSELMSLMTTMMFSYYLTILNFSVAVMFITVVMILMLITNYGKKLMKKKENMKIIFIKIIVSSSFLILYTPFFLN